MPILCHFCSINVFGDFFPISSLSFDSAITVKATFSKACQSGDSHPNTTRYLFAKAEGPNQSENCVFNFGQISTGS